MRVGNPRTAIKIAVAIAAFLLIAFYAYIQARNFLKGPQLTIRTPVNGQLVASTSPEIVLDGNAHNIAFLTVNGLQIFTDENGAFSRKLLLAPGYTIITVEAQDKFERSIKREIQLIVK